LEFHHFAEECLKHILCKFGRGCHIKVLKEILRDIFPRKGYMNVLSLFDGISCARMALQRAGVEVATYYASEIEPNAIKVAMAQHPTTKQLGNVKDLKLEELPRIDLLVGGSPCQDLSSAKHERKGLEGDRSGLFWQYAKIKKALNPKWWLLENVASMRVSDRDKITAEMGVQPILFDAALVSAQSRKRLFWTNIPFTLPEDKGIKLKDILLKDVPEKLWFKGKYTATKRGKRDIIRVGHVGESTGQANRVYSPDGKSQVLLSGGGGLGAKTGLYEIYVPEGDSKERIRVGHDVRRRLKDGVRADYDTSIKPIRRMEVRNDDKCGTLTTVQKDNHVVDVVDKRIRKLDPVECERLQGLPDGYTEGIADSNRYKVCGNAFNVDVVAHILRGMS
jgi:DNA (cytosine-5)-methyltransferase 3A